MSISLSFTVAPDAPKKAGLVNNNPYPGLRPFLEEEEHLFFGRERQINRMIDKLRPERFLAIVGGSGSGKSSLVNCGLRPALHRGLMAEAGTAWRVAQFRPGIKPIQALSNALAVPGVLFPPEEESGLTESELREVVESTLRISALGLVNLYRQACPEGSFNLLVVVDQFEELFRYRRLSGRGSDQYGMSEEATAFVRLLLEGCGQKKYPIYVVLTMRSDFLGDCAQFEGLPEAINEGQYLVPRMSRDERRSAIEGPAAVTGGTIGSVLLTRLVNDVGDNPDQLSILQHALNRTWARCRHDAEAGGELLPAHYEDIGSMAGALDRHAEKAFAELGTPRQQQICEKIFRALTDKGTDPRGTRRPTPFSSLCALAEASPEELAGVLAVFRKPSRSFLMPPAQEKLEADTVIDISHESLMRVWTRLSAWADKEASSARTYRRVSETAALWEANKTGLIRDRELETLLEWWNAEQPNAAWAAQYQGNWESAWSLMDKSKEARLHDLAEAQFERRWVRLWRPLMCAAFVVALGCVVYRIAQSPPRPEDLPVLQSLVRLFPKSSRWDADQEGVAVLFLFLASCGFAALVAGYAVISVYGRRACRAVTFDRILEEVSNPSSLTKSGPVSVALQQTESGRPAAAVREPYAGFPRRFAAGLIDAFIFMVIAIALAAFFAALNIGNYGSDAVFPDDWATETLMCLALGANWLLQALLISSRWQATIGMRALSIVVTDLEGRRVSFSRASGRYFSAIISWSILTIGFLMQPFTKKKQTLHDKMSGCLVVVRPRVARNAPKNS